MHHLVLFHYNQTNEKVHIKVTKVITKGFCILHNIQAKSHQIYYSNNSTVLLRIHKTLISSSNIEDKMSTSENRRTPDDASHRSPRAFFSIKKIIYSEFTCFAVISSVSCTKALSRSSLSKAI